jgi:hypothetical protein
MSKDRTGPDFQTLVATMGVGRPSDTCPQSWYAMARIVDQNRAANEAFMSTSALTTVTSVPTRPISASPRPIGADIGKHIPSQFDVRALSINKLQDLLDDRLTKPDVVADKQVRHAELAPPGNSPKQRVVSRTPPPSSSNRFSVLPVDEIAEIDESVDRTQVVRESVSNTETLSPRAKWERRLPAKFVIASSDDSTPSRSLKLKVEIETTDTGEVKSLSALVDSGATGRFIDRDFVKANRLRTRTLSRPIPVRNVDGTLNEAGSITEMVDLILRYKNHSERALFAVTSLGAQTLILGLPWLQRHNPEIDWTTGTVKMNRCPPQ